MSSVKLLYVLPMHAFSKLPVFFLFLFFQMKAMLKNSYSSFSFLHVF